VVVVVVVLAVVGFIVVVQTIRWKELRGGSLNESSTNICAGT